MDAGVTGAALDRAAVRSEMESARLDFRQLIGDATAAELHRPTDGTRWTNQQLLFHMLFGYLIVRALLVLVRVFGLLPGGASKAFARLLDSAHRPFHLINYLGSCAGAWVISPGRMTRMLDRVIAALQQQLQRETGSALRRGMHYPTTWDLFFAEYMTLADIYRYPTQHFRFHQRQLTLSPPSPALLRSAGEPPGIPGSAAGSSGWPAGQHATSARLLRRCRGCGLALSTGSAVPLTSVAPYLAAPAGNARPLGG